MIRRFAGSSVSARGYKGTSRIFLWRGIHPTLLSDIQLLTGQYQTHYYVQRQKLENRDSMKHVWVDADQLPSEIRPV
jgi:hypothetical protein